MKYIGACLALVVWTIATILMCIPIFVPVFLAADAGWFDTPHKIIKAFEK